MSVQWFTSLGPPRGTVINSVRFSFPTLKFVATHEIDDLIKLTIFLHLSNWFANRITPNLPGSPATARCTGVYPRVFNHIRHFFYQNFQYPLPTWHVLYLSFRMSAPLKVELGP